MVTQLVIEGVRPGARVLCVLVLLTLARAVPLCITRRQKGRTDCKWTRRKLRGECAWYFGFCSEDACFLAFPGAWAGSRFAFFCFPPQPLFSHSHTKPPLPLKVLPSPFLLLSPSDFTSSWLLIYRGVDTAHNLPCHVHQCKPHQGPRGRPTLFPPQPQSFLTA